MSRTQNMDQHSTSDEFSEESKVVKPLQEFAQQFGHKAWVLGVVLLRIRIVLKLSLERSLLQRSA